MRLLQRADVTPETGGRLDDAARDLTDAIDTVIVANHRIRQLEYEISTLRAGMPPMPASRRETELQQQVAQLTRNLAAMEDRLAVAEGRDTRVRMRFAR